MIHNMVYGGQSDGSVEAATIVVTYPEGSVCTVTNGSQTYTALDTSAAAAFIVEPGTWTVTAVQGSDSASESVTVTAGGWVKVELSFWLWLYNYETKKYGVNFQSLAKAFNPVATLAAAPVITELSDGTIQVEMTVGSHCGMWYSDAVDLTKFNTLYVLDSTSTMQGGSRADIAVWTSIGTYIEDNLVAHLEQRDRAEELRSLDISMLSGSHNIGYALYNRGTILMKQMYLV